MDRQAKKKEQERKLEEKKAAAAAKRKRLVEEKRKKSAELLREGSSDTPPKEGGSGGGDGGGEGDSSSSTRDGLPPSVPKVGGTRGSHGGNAKGDGGAVGVVGVEGTPNKERVVVVVSPKSEGGGEVKVGDAVVAAAVAAIVDAVVAGADDGAKEAAAAEAATAAIAAAVGAMVDAVVAGADGGAEEAAAEEAAGGESLAASAAATAATRTSGEDAVAENASDSAAVAAVVGAAVDAVVAGAAAGKEEVAGDDDPKAPPADADPAPASAPEGEASVAVHGAMERPPEEGDGVSAMESRGEGDDGNGKGDDGGDHVEGATATSEPPDDQSAEKAGSGGPLEETGSTLAASEQKQEGEGLKQAEQETGAADVTAERLDPPVVDDGAQQTESQPGAPLASELAGSGLSEGDSVVVGAKEDASLVPAAAVVDVSGAEGVVDAAAAVNEEGPHGDNGDRAASEPLGERSAETGAGGLDEQECPSTEAPSVQQEGQQEASDAATVTSAASDNTETVPSAEGLGSVVNEDEAKPEPEVQPEATLNAGVVNGKETAPGGNGGDGDGDGSSDEDDAPLGRSMLTRTGATSNLRVDELLDELAASGKLEKDATSATDSTPSPIGWVRDTRGRLVRQASGNGSTGETGAEEGSSLLPSPASAFSTANGAVPESVVALAPEDTNFVTPERSPQTEMDGRGDGGGGSNSGQAVPKLLPGPAERRSVVTPLGGLVSNDGSEGGEEGRVPTVEAAAASAAWAAGAAAAAALKSGEFSSTEEKPFVAGEGKEKAASARKKKGAAGTAATEATTGGRKMSAAAARKKRRHQERLEAKNRAALAGVVVDPEGAGVVKGSPLKVLLDNGGNGDDKGGSQSTLESSNKTGVWEQIVRDRGSGGDGGDIGINGDGGHRRGDVVEVVDEVGGGRRRPDESSSLVGAEKTTEAVESALPVESQGEPNAEAGSTPSPSRARQYSDSDVVTTQPTGDAPS